MSTHDHFMFCCLLCILTLVIFVWFQFCFGRNFVIGIWYLEFGIRQWTLLCLQYFFGQKLSYWYLVFGSGLCFVYNIFLGRNFVIGIWYLAFGIWQKLQP